MVKKIVLIFLYIYFIVTAFSKYNCPLNTSHYTLYSQNVKDSFTIKIILPKKYNATKKYNTVYFMDANIKSGTKLINLLNESKNSNVCDSTIFIGIGHIGNFHSKRRRDFLPPLLVNLIVQNSTDNNYGRANLFYNFLQKELIPLMEKKYKLTQNRSIIGHSFGGLFAYYCMFKNERLFNQFYALSPSLWVDDGNVFNYEKQYYAQHKALPVKLYTANGSLEVFNYIIPSNRKMNDLLKLRSYTNLQFNYIEKQNANHNSHVQLTLQEVLNRIKL